MTDKIEKRKEDTVSLRWEWVETEGVAKLPGEPLDNTNML